MRQKSYMRLLIATLFNLFFCLIVFVWLFPFNLEIIAQEQPPDAFLGPIYYGEDTVNAIFDHNLPVLSIGGGDGINNICTQHYDGSACNDDPPEGYGYDEHDGIDYGLSYEPVLAAANGTVYQAGWSNPADHRIGLGLRVRIDHPNDYRTEYGHLSTISIETGDPVTANPEIRAGIIGISGNTGNVWGWNCDPDDTPTCGAHLHFGLINPDGIRVNPYGWIGDLGTDPWDIDEDGAASHNLWIAPPAITTDQYPTGTEEPEPAVNEYLIEVDDSDSDFFTTDGSCWTEHIDTEGINGGYRAATVELVADFDNPPPDCSAKWTFDPEIEAPLGDYDVYVHVPDYASTLHTIYSIRHNGQLDEAIVVQAAYPNDAHNEWAYIGRYDFGLNGSPLDSRIRDYIRVSNQTINDPASTGTMVVADAIRLLPANSLPDLEVAISQSSDDAGGPNLEYEGNCGDENSDRPEVYLGHCEDGSSTISGFRFQNVVIPDGATVAAARLEFTVDTTDDNVIDVQFRGELAGDAVTFSVGDLPSDRISSLTNAAVPWHIANDGGWWVSEAQVSPDLSTVIQEVIDQPDWNSGNAIVIIMQPTSAGTTSRRVFGWDRYGGNPLQSAKLQIWYTEPPLPPAPTNLTAVYKTSEQSSLAILQPNRIIMTPEPAPLKPYIVLSWQPNPPPSGTTFNVYRSRSYPNDDDFDLIAWGVRYGAFSDFFGRETDWYRVTAVNEDGESLPSNVAQAWCFDC